MKAYVPLIALFAAVGPVFAAEVTVDQAKIAVGNWVKRGRALDRELGRTVVSARTCMATNGAPFHVVKLDRGFVITTGDTKLAPVIVHSSGEDLVEDEANPLWVLVRKDIALRAAVAGVVPTQGRAMSFAMTAKGAGTGGQTAEELEWVDLLRDDSSSSWQQVLNAASGRDEIQDVRVEPLLKSEWAQEDYRNYGLTGDGENCYNYWTPNHWPCGCVATAGAQIMRYFEWPTAAVAKNAYPCEYQTGIKDLGDGWYEVLYGNATYTMQGGTYEWSKMPLVPADGATKEQRQAIGKLTSDVGIACGMRYGENGSGAGGYMLARALPTDFGYSNAVALQKSSCTADEIKKVMISNLDAGLPVAVSIGNGGSAGHEIVGDGYGYSAGTFYCHFNLGWGGLSDAWYAPPAIAEYTVVDGFVYNIYKTEAKGSVICSGRVLTASGSPVASATVQAKIGSTVKKTVQTNSKGIYALILPPGSYTVVATSAGSSGTKSITLSACVGLEICDVASGYFGSYWVNPTPEVHNLYDQNITLSAAVVAPSAPTGVSATDGSSTANVTVKWNSVSGATSYRVYRATSSTGAKTELGSWQTSCSYTDASATPGTQYYYWVKAMNSGGMSGFSSSDTGYRKLSKPTSVSATDGTSSAEVTVTWSVVTGASYYRVYRSTTSTGTKAALGSWQTSCTYKDSGATAGTTYYYFVQAAVDNSGLRPGDYSAYDTGYKAVVKRPPNDTFAQATVISGQRCTSGGSNKDAAQKESGEPNHAGYATATSSIWWKWTAPYKGKVQIDTIGSSIDTVLAVYTGSSVGALTSVAYDDDNGEGFTSRVDFTAAKGTTYFIAVSGVSGEYGDIVLNLQQFPEGQTAISKAVVSTSSKMQFSFKAQAGKTYYVQRATSLANGGNWTTVQTIKPTATSVQSVEAAIDTSKQSGFYRILTAE